MITTINNKHNKLNVPNKREQNQTCLDSAEREGLRPKGNVPNLRFKEFEGEWSVTTLQKDCKVNPTNEKIADKFVYVDLESVTQGQLNKHQILTKEEAPSRAQRVLHTDDILFQCVRPYQMNNYMVKDAMSNIQWVASTGYAQIRTQIDYPTFLYYVLNTPKYNKAVMVRCTGSSYPAINSDDLSKIPFYKCGIAEQRKIATFLSLLDERIATQSKIIDKLQSLIKGISNRIFASIQGIEYRMGDIVTITNGNSNVQDAVTQSKDGLYPFFDRSEDIKYLPTFLFDKEAIIYPGEGTEFMPRYFKGKFALHQRCYAIFDFNEIINARFLYFYLKTRNSYFVKNAVGSTVPSLRLDTFQKLKVIIPPTKTQHSVSSCLSSMEQKCNVEKKILYKLLNQKQYLLRQMFI